MKLAFPLSRFHADGIWIPDVRTKETKLVPAIVDYSCYRHGGIDLAGTDAFRLEVTATPVVGTIHIDTDFLKVVTWSKTLIQTQQIMAIQIIYHALSVK